MPHLSSLNGSFFLAEFYASCSTVLFIEIFDGWCISRTEQKMTDFRTHTSFSPAVFSSIERKDDTTCSQSPLALPEVKSPHFPRELGHHNLIPYISPTTVVQIWSRVPAKSPIAPQHKNVVNIQFIASRVTKRLCNVTCLQQLVTIRFDVQEK